MQDGAGIIRLKRLSDRDFCSADTVSGDRGSGLPPRDIARRCLQFYEGFAVPGNIDAALRDGQGNEIPSAVTPREAGRSGVIAPMPTSVP